MDLESWIDEKISMDDLKRFEHAYDEEVAHGEVSENTTFQYAHCLIRSSKKNIRLGINLFKLLLRHTQNDELRREYVYYLAIGCLKLKRYDEALNYIRALILAEPNNRQARALEELIEKRKQRDAIFGAAIVGGLSILGAAVIIGTIAFVARRARDTGK